MPIFDKPCEPYGDESCRCGALASHKVEEMRHSYLRRVPDEILAEYERRGLPFRRHPLTQYVCCEHFALLMGPASPCLRVESLVGPRG